MLTYLGSSLTEEEYISQRCKQDKGTGKGTKAALSNLKLFCQDQFDRELKTVLSDLKEETHRTQHIDSTLHFLQKFATWLGEPHHDLLMSPNAIGIRVPCRAKDLDSIKGYIIQARLFLRKVGGIPIDKDALSDYKISYPAPQEKEEPRPLLPSEFKIICDNQRNFRRQMLYRIKRGSEDRIGAMVQLKKKNFDTTKRPIEIFFSKYIMKKKNGISYNNTKYVLAEDEEPLLNLLERFDDEDLVFGTNKIVEQAVNNEDRAWSRLVTSNKVNLGERYIHSGKLKVTLHTIKSMTFTAACEAVDETYANAYGDHARYTKNYLRWTYEKKIEKFRKLESYISIYTKIVKVDEVSPKVIEENKSIKQMNLEKDELIVVLAEKLKDQTKKTPKEDLKKMMLKLLKENNLL